VKSLSRFVRAYQCVTGRLADSSTLAQRAWACQFLQGLQKRIARVESAGGARKWTQGPLPAASPATPSERLASSSVSRSVFACRARSVLVAAHPAVPTPIILADRAGFHASIYLEGICAPGVINYLFEAGRPRMPRRIPWLAVPICTSVRNTRANFRFDTPHRHDAPCPGWLVCKWHGRHSLSGWTSRHWTI